MVRLDLQVQSDHYEDFYAVELEKHGYTGVYKKKTGEVRFILLYVVIVPQLVPFLSVFVGII